MKLAHTNLFFISFLSARLYFLFFKYYKYRSRSSRFKSNDRRPKAEGLWSDRARRRLWCRIMRREVGLNRNTDLTKVMPRIQQGLGGIHAARVRIEDIMKQAPEAAQSEQMQSLVASVRKNIADITSILDQTEKQQGAGPHVAVIKKLRNDVVKEEVSEDSFAFAFDQKLKSFSRTSFVIHPTFCLSLPLPHMHTH